VTDSPAGKRYLATVVSALHPDQSDLVKTSRLLRFLQDTEATQWTFNIDGVYVEVLRVRRVDA
jgi:hypothetical protein